MSSKSRKSNDSHNIPKNFGMNIEHLIQELANKTALVEELLQEKRDKYFCLTIGTSWQRRQLA
jgi:hypothetical protein